MANTMPDQKHTELPRNIGVASMDLDGVITLRLRACLDDGSGCGEGYFVYKPDHPDYHKIYRHLNGIKPGEEKLVPPWENQFQGDCSH